MKQMELSKQPLTIEAAKDVKKKDVLLMQIDPTTGKVTFVAIEKLLTKPQAKLQPPSIHLLGPVMLIGEGSVVTKKVSPEKYADKKGS